MTGSSLVNTILDSIATTDVGQLLLKRVDTVFRGIEKPVRFCAYGEPKINQNLPWMIFWFLVVSIQIFRIVVSTTLVIFNKSPITSKIILKEIQKWRRSLRCTRFKGTRIMNERQRGKEMNRSSTSGGSGSPGNRKKRTNTDMLEDNLIEELLNLTLSDTTDVDDSTFVPSRLEMSTNESSTVTDEHHSSDLKNHIPATKSDQIEQTNKSNEATFESAAGSDYVSTGGDSATSYNEEPTSESNSELSGPENKLLISEQPKKVGKESLNDLTDPTDILIAKLTEIHQNGNVRGNNRHSKKKGLKSSLIGNENLFIRQKPVKSAKSDETVNRL